MAKYYYYRSLVDGILTMCDGDGAVVFITKDGLLHIEKSGGCIDEQPFDVYQMIKVIDNTFEMGDPICVGIIAYIERGVVFGVYKNGENVMTNVFGIVRL